MERQLIKDACNIICEASNLTAVERLNLVTMLEAANTPVANKYVEKLYDSVVKKGHIDFDTIPTSKGDIESYSKYDVLVETLSNLKRLAELQSANDVLKMVETVEKSISIVKSLKPQYMLGFQKKNEYVAIEYNTYVYTIIQATSAILYDYVDYIKRPDTQTISIALKNNVMRANKFYYEQLAKFVVVASKSEYAKFLDASIRGDKENFIGTIGYAALGVAALVGVALAIVPITRELIYQFYHLRTKASDCFTQQAYFLEMNRTVVEANSAISPEKKKDILAKQESLRLKLVKIADKLRVNHAMSENSTKMDLKKDNKLMSLNNIERSSSESPLQLM